jgi:hypothetical protein
MKVGALDLGRENSNIKVICEWTLPYSGTSERIVYAGFMEDINPDFVFVVTSDGELQTSRIYILTVNMRSEKDRLNFNDDSCSSSGEEDEVNAEAGVGVVNDSMHSHEDNDQQLKQKLQKQLSENHRDFKLRKFIHDENYVLQLDATKFKKVINTRIDNGTE